MPWLPLHLFRFFLGDSETSKSSEIPKDPKNGDDVEPPKEVVETVDANWGEGLEEKRSLYFRGSRNEPCDNPKKVPDGDDDEYEPSIAGG